MKLGETHRKVQTLLNFCPVVLLSLIGFTLWVFFFWKHKLVIPSCWFCFLPKYLWLTCYVTGRLRPSFSFSDLSNIARTVVGVVGIFWFCPWVMINTLMYSVIFQFRIEVLLGS